MHLKYDWEGRRAGAASLAAWGQRPKGRTGRHAHVCLDRVSDLPSRSSQSSIEGPRQSFLQLTYGSKRLLWRLLTHSASLVKRSRSVAERERTSA